jgi:hypothetical protein
VTGPGENVQKKKGNKEKERIGTVFSTEIPLKSARPGLVHGRLGNVPLSRTQKSGNRNIRQN